MYSPSIELLKEGDATLVSGFPISDIATFCSDSFPKTLKEKNNKYD